MEYWIAKTGEKVKDATAADQSPEHRANISGKFFPPSGKNQIRKHIKNFIEQNCGYSCLELWIGEGKRQASRCGNDLRGSGVEEDRE